MAGSVPDAIERAVLDHINDVATFTVTGPLELRLMETIGDDSTTGTEVSGGSYAGQTITPTSAATDAGTTSASNDADINFEDMPAVASIPGWEIWDSTATPVRIWHGTFDVAKEVLAGETVRVAAGELELNAD